MARLRDQLLPLVERAHRTVRESIEAIGRMRQVPSMRIERAEAVNIVLLARDRQDEGSGPVGPGGQS